MTLFRTVTQRGVWIEEHCVRCWQGGDAGDPAKPQCPILAKAIRTERKPSEWQRNPRANTIAGMYKCNEFSTKPPRVDRQGRQQLSEASNPKGYEDVPLFDVTPYASEHPGYVPVEGWPERPGTAKEVDHQ